MKNILGKDVAIHCEELPEINKIALMFTHYIRFVSNTIFILLLLPATMRREAYDRPPGEEPGLCQLPLATRAICCIISTRFQATRSDSWSCLNSLIVARCTNSTPSISESVSRVKNLMCHLGNNLPVSMYSSRRTLMSCLSSLAMLSIRVSIALWLPSMYCTKHSS